MVSFCRKMCWRQQNHRQQVDRLLKVIHALFVVFEITLVLFMFTLFASMVIDDNLNHRDCSSKSNTREAADTDVYKDCTNHNCRHSLSPPLIKEIIIVISCKVRFSRSLTTKRLTITNLLQIIKTAGDALITRAVESVEADAGATVDSRVNLRTSKDRIAVCIHDARSRSGVGIYKVAASVSRVIRSFKVAITKRSLKYGKSWYGLAVALELGFTFTICSLDSSFNLCDSLCVGLRDNQADTVFRSATIDGFRFPDVGVAPACVRTGDNFHGICHFCIFTHCHIPP
nr:MAG TPA: hypothetical protein [Caudoviricetes sp.]